MTLFYTQDCECQDFKNINVYNIYNDIILNIYIFMHEIITSDYKVYKVPLDRKISFKSATESNRRIGLHRRQIKLEEFY